MYEIPRRLGATLATAAAAAATFACSGAGAAAAAGAGTFGRNFRVLFRRKGDGLYKNGVRGPNGIREFRVMARFADARKPLPSILVWNAIF